MRFLWPDEGATHSYQVMLAESHWLSSGYTRSLLMATPVETITRWVQAAWHWLFVDSGFSHWLASFREISQKGSGLIPSLNGFGASLISRLGEYLQVTLWVTLILFIRVMILFLSIPCSGWSSSRAPVCGVGRERRLRVRAEQSLSVVNSLMEIIFLAPKYI
ncbi:DUF4400 domain-containing protein [Pantoea ananatis]|nr:DUF4400 domain-containing protein [Pantoea ananatis]MDS7722086.1 DUF4400 domain-containing protein [Pantoea ananatis]